MACPPVVGWLIVEEDDDKRVEARVSTSMGGQRSTQEYIDMLRERWAMSAKLTAKPPAQPFGEVLATTGQAPSADTAAPSSPSPSSPLPEARKVPLPSVRHPDAPPAQLRGKVIIKP